MTIQFNNGQKKASAMTIDWYKKQIKQVFELAGYAGTGKSTIIKYVTEELGLTSSEIAYVTYTGKASLVLTMKGVPATTIHKLIYRMEDTFQAVKDKNGNEIIENGVPKMKRVSKFVKVPSIDKTIKLIVADECSMISENIWNDLLSYEVPIIVLGDRGQLPPIHGSSPLLQNPDFELTEVMRQAEDDPITHLATLARKGRKIEYGRYSSRCWVIPRAKITDMMLNKTDITISCTNKSRNHINQYIRELKGFTNDLPQRGDKLICRKNDWSKTVGDYPLINGMIGYVENDVSRESMKPYSNSVLLDFRPEFLKEENQYFDYLEADCRPLLDPSLDLKSITGDRFNKNNIFEYGYGITTHLSQGSSWDSVLFHADIWGKEEIRKQLLYTGITRAERVLILAL